MSTTTFKLPPTERDFEIYEAVHVGNASTWSQAAKHQISQTRVRQIIRRVVEWLGEVLPPQAKIAREQEIHLARQIAASRFQHQLEEATAFWNEARELKYAGLRMRLTAAQARLGVVAGMIDGLAADAIEGIPVPVWQAPAEAEAAAEPNSTSDPSKADEIRKSWLPPADASHQPRRRGKIEMPRELWDPFTFDELTPEIVAARAAWGYPIHPNVIQHAQEEGRMWPRPDAEKPTHEGADASASQCAVTSPPVEDFSSPHDDPADSTPPPAAPVAQTAFSATAYANAPSRPSGASAEDCPTAQHLLTTPAPLKITEVRIVPDNAGALVSQTAPSPA